MRYPDDPPTVEEIVAVVRQAAHDRHGWRLRAMIVVLGRGGLRVQEALARGLSVVLCEVGVSDQACIAGPGST